MTIGQGPVQPRPFLTQISNFSEICGCDLAILCANFPNFRTCFLSECMGTCTHRKFGNSTCRDHYIAIFAVCDPEIWKKIASLGRAALNLQLFRSSSSCTKRLHKVYPRPCAPKKVTPITRHSCWGQQNRSAFGSVSNKSRKTPHVSIFEQGSEVARPAYPRRPQPPVTPLPLPCTCAPIMCIV